MTSSERNRVERRDFTIAAAAIAGGLIVAGVALLQFATDDGSQALTRTQWAQTTPAPREQDDKAKPPADSNAERPAPVDPTSRPTTPPPQPARPDVDAQNKGAKPALPPAPAEKTAPPIDAK